ncbi:MAG: AAA family ATPase [Nitrospiria bacterium]
MIVLELACFGLRNLRQVTKLALKPGVNVIHGRTGAGKTTLFECLRVLLLGSSPGLLASGSHGAAQGAVTLKLRSGTIYRVARDFAKETFHLLRWDAAGKAFVSESTDPGIIERLWQPECDGLPLEVLRTHIAWTPGWIPDTPSTGEALPDFTGASAPADHALTPEERAAKVSRLAELTGALAGAEQTSHSIEERTEARGREVQARNRLAALDALRARRRASAERGHEMAPLLGGPQDLDGQLDGYAKALAAAHEEREASEEELAQIGIELDVPTRPIWQAPLFWAGAVGTGVSFLAAVFVPLTGGFQHLYLAGLAAGFGLLIASVALDFRGMGRRKALDTRRTELTRKMSRADDRLKKTYAAPVALMTQTKCPDVETLKTKRRAAREWAAEEERLEREEAAILGGTTREALETDWQAIKIRAETLTQHAADEVDLESLQDAIGALTRELQSAAPPRHAPDLPAAGGAPVDPLAAHGADINACLLRLSEERLEAVSVRAGTVAVRRRGATTDSTLDHLSTGESVLARTAIVLGAWAARRAGLGLPLLLDDPLSPLDLRSRKVLLDTMTGVAGDRQILLFANDPLPEMPGVTQIPLAIS